jgi:integrase
MNLISVRDEEIEAAKKAGRAQPKNLSPDWLKRNPESGIYYVYIFRADRAPKRLCRSTEERDSKDRARVIGEKIIARWLGEEAASGEPVQVRFAHVCDEVLEDMFKRVNSKKAVGKIKASTLENAELYIGRYLKEEFGHLWIRSITPAHFDEFVETYQSLKPGQTLYSHYKHMNIVMQFAIKQGYRTEPFKIVNPDPEAKEQRKLTDEEKTALVETSTRDTRLEVVWGLTMGCRLREILRQCWTYHPASGCTGPDASEHCHVDLTERTMTVCRAHAKTKNSARTIRLNDTIYEMLVRRHQTRRNRSSFVFPARSNPDKAKHQNKTAWRQLKANAGIEGKLKFHALRHTFLSDCAIKVRHGQVSVPQVCKYAGLSMKVFESVYLHLNHKDTEDVANLIAVKLPEHTFQDRVKNTTKQEILNEVP